MSALRVLVDGAPLADHQARAFWKRYSDWMEEHPGDLAGFALREGLSSVHPEMQGGGPVLVASRTQPQSPYGVAPKRPVERQPAASRPAGGSAPSEGRSSKGAERKR
jgi:hypothetical protein